MFSLQVTENEEIIISSSNYSEGDDVKLPEVLHHRHSDFYHLTMEEIPEVLYHIEWREYDVAESILDGAKQREYENTLSGFKNLFGN